jgi:predicted ATP-grasp superfamily ATP-dependent carboligase
MINSISTTQRSKNNVFVNSVIIAGMSSVGLLGGLAKSKLIDEPDMQKELNDEFIKNRKIILDEQKFQNYCNELTDAAAKFLKKNNIKNLAVGALIGLAAGIGIVFAKIQYNKSKVK